MKSKKGDLYFDLPLIIIILFILGYAMITIYNLTGDRTEELGQKQQAIIDTSSISKESALRYLDFAGKFVGEQAVYGIGQSGGYYEEPSCGNYLGYVLWDNVNEECFPTKESLNEQFQPFAQNYLNSYLAAYPDLAASITGYDYLFQIIGNEFYALPLKRVAFTLKTVEKNAPPETAEEVITPEGLVHFTDVCSQTGGCTLTEEAYKLLLRAQEIAQKKGVSLEAYSTYRSVEKQINIWEGRTPENYKQRFPNEAERRGYVCYPYGDDVEQRCSHLSGNAIDIRFKGKNAATMTPEDWTLLYGIMAEAGWVRYENEPWHFECCSTERYARAQEEGVTTIV